MPNDWPDQDRDIHHAADHTQDLLKSIEEQILEL
jgi:hypothetical protein